MESYAGNVEFEIAKVEKNLKWQNAAKFIVP